MVSAQDTNEEEFYNFMKKCGVVAEDHEGARMPRRERGSEGVRE